MKLSFKGVLTFFILLMLACILQLFRFSFTPDTHSAYLEQRQLVYDLNILIRGVRQHSAFAAQDTQRITDLSTAANLTAKLYPLGLSRLRFESELQRLLSLLDDPGATSMPPPSPQDTAASPARLTLSRHNGLTAALDAKILLLLNLWNGHGNSGLAGSASSPGSGILPVRLTFEGQNWLPFNESNEPLEPDFPYLTHIDGIPMSRWIRASQQYLPDSLKHSRTAQAHWLRQLDTLRQDIGISAAQAVRLTLAGPEQSSSQLTLPLISRDSTRAALLSDPVPAGLDAGAIIRLEPSRDGSLPPESLDRLMLAFERPMTLLDIRKIETRQDALLSLLSGYFGEPQARDNRAFALAHYRRAADFRSDHLHRQGLSPLSELGFFEQAKLSQAGFEDSPGSAGLFSRWQVRTRPRVPRVANGNRLALLIDSQCKMECEWIAHIASLWPRVTLVGEPTRGSLGKRHSITLPQSGLEVGFSSSLVYSIDGSLLSGVGIKPTLPLASHTLAWRTIIDTLAAHKLAKGREGATTPHLASRKAVR